MMDVNVTDVPPAETGRQAHAQERMRQCSYFFWERLGTPESAPDQISNAMKTSEQKKRSKKHVLQAEGKDIMGLGRKRCRFWRRLVRAAEAAGNYVLPTIAQSMNLCPHVSLAGFRKAV
jgi:hypothetical protein